MSASPYTIVVPAYQAEDTLGETLDAIQRQTLEDWQCIVVDDASVDGTHDVATRAAENDSRIRVLRHAQNRGSGGAYNTGVSAADTQWVILCSADDILLPSYLASMSSFVQSEPGYDIYTSNGYFWFPGKGREAVYSPDVRGSVISLTLADVIRCCFYSVGAIYRRGLFDEIGGYREHVFGEDFDFWLRAMAHGARHRYLPELLSLHRVSSSQKSSNLEAAYRSDIRLVQELSTTHALSAAERLAVGECVQERERLIGDLKPGRRGLAKLRAKLRRGLASVFGERAVNDLAARIRGRR